MSNELSFMNIFSDFKKYRDIYGLNQLNTDGEKGGTTQNGALFTLEYLVCIESLAPDTVGMLGEFGRLKDVFNSLEVLPGLTRRSPDSLEGDSMDNNGASLVFSALYGYRDFANRMWNHGQGVRATGVDMVQDPTRNMKFYPIAWLLNGCKAPRYFWNNTRPSEFCIWGWYGRSPGFLALASLCATDKMTKFQALALWVGQFLGCFKEKSDTDARKLPYLVWQVLKRRNLFWKLSYKLWCKILMHQYENGMRDVYSLYYQDPNHPIRKYSLPFIE